MTAIIVIGAALGVATQAAEFGFWLADKIRARRAARRKG